MEVSEEFLYWFPLANGISSHRSRQATGTHRLTRIKESRTEAGLCPKGRGFMIIPREIPKERDCYKRMLRWLYDIPQDAERSWPVRVRRRMKHHLKQAQKWGASHR